MTVLIEGRVSYGVRKQVILDDVRVEVGRGRCLAIVGPNGAGKTTLVRLLVGLLRPERGGLRVDGQAYETLTRREFAKLFAYVPQKTSIRAPLTVRELVLMGRYPHAGRWSFGHSLHDREIATQAMARVEVDHLGDRPVTELSGGESQAAMIASALAQEPEVLVLDEPTTFLDPGHQRRITGVLERLIEDGTTVVLASHDLNLALALSHETLALAEGRLRGFGPTADVLTPTFLESLYDAPFRFVAGMEKPFVAFDLR